MTITARLADGTELNFPDGTDPGVIQNTVKSVIAQRTPEKPVSQSIGDSLRQIPRQLGLTARYGIEGLAQAADIVNEPVRRGLNAISSALFTPQQTTADLVAGRKPQAPTIGTLPAAASHLADSLGLPSPQGSNERVIGDMSRTAVGAMTGSGIAGRLAGAVTNPVTQRVLSTLATQPGTQAVAAAGGAGAGGAVREAGGSPGEQAVASLVTAMAAPSAVNAVSSGANRVVNALTPKAAQLADVDAQISLSLKNQGIDWSAVSPSIKAQIREEAAKALNGGTNALDSDALRRLLVFKNVAGTKPTVGMLTQDPGQLTREKNLAKIGANSTDPSLQALPNLESENTAAILSGLDRAGAKGAPNAFDAGAATVGALNSRIAAAKANTNALYETARNAAGRDVELDGHAFTQAANNALTHNLAPKLGAEVDNALNDIATGKTPLTVGYAEQLKTMLGRKQRAAQATQGDLAYAYGIVRKALDDAPLKGMPAAVDNPEGLPAVVGQVPTLSNEGQSALEAFKQARAAHAQFMARLESNPALKAAADGAQPDNFVKDYIVGRSATAADLKSLRSEVGDTAANQIKSYIVGHLKDAATGGAQDINKFSSAAYNRALENIGDAKLSVFFSPAEIKQLRDIGQAGRYMQAQPAGSAVNNSNSGALVSANALDALDKVAGKVPIVGGIVQGTVRGVQQRQVMAPANALGRPLPVQPKDRNALSLLMLPQPQ